MREWVRVLLSAGLVALAGACAPAIGDACETALDCSTSGSRLCDRTQFGGYCTLEGCEEDSCPDDAVCVQFGLREDGVPLDRLIRTYCMAGCDESSDCRDDEGYECYSGESFGASNEARVIGSSSKKFCAPEAQRTATAPAPTIGVGAPERAPDEGEQPIADD